MDRITRHELKKDKFAEEVLHGVEYVGEHRRQVTRYGSLALAVLVIAGGTWAYMSRQKQARQAALAEALRIQASTVGETQGPGSLTYPTPQARFEAVSKALNDVAAKYPGSNEAMVCTFMLGGEEADKGNLAEAEKHFKLVASKANNDYASMARQSLAMLYATQGKLDEAEKLLREIMAKPSAMVTKDQAALTLARLLRDVRPADAKKLCEPLRTTGTGAVNRTAISICAEIDNPSLRTR